MRGWLLVGLGDMLLGFGACRTCQAEQRPQLLQHQRQLLHHALRHQVRQPRQALHPHCPAARRGVQHLQAQLHGRAWVGKQRGPCLGPDAAQDAGGEPRVRWLARVLQGLVGTESILFYFFATLLHWYCTIYLYIFY